MSWWALVQLAFKENMTVLETDQMSLILMEVLKLSDVVGRSL